MMKSIYPHCKSPIATSFVLSHERKRTVEAGSSAHVLFSGAGLDGLRVPLSNQILPKIPGFHEAVDDEEAIGSVEDVGWQIARTHFCFAGSSQLWWDVCRRASHLKRQLSELVSSRTNANLNTTGLLLCKFLNLQLTFNFLLGFHTGQLLHPLI